MPTMYMDPLGAQRSRRYSPSVPPATVQITPEMQQQIVDSRLAQSTRVFCRGKAPSPAQLERMREVIAKDYIRSTTGYRRSKEPFLPLPVSASSQESVLSGKGPQQTLWTRACDRHLLPAVETPHKVLTIPGAQVIGKQRGAGECGVLCVRENTTINFDPCEPGQEHFESWTHQIHKVPGWNTSSSRKVFGRAPSRGGRKSQLERDHQAICAQFGMHQTVGRSQPSRASITY